MLDRFVAAFVAPVEQGEATPGHWVEPAAPAPATIAVLAPPDQGVAVGAAAALALATGTVVVAVWGARTAGPRAPAAPRARRLAAKLTDRGHEATATGRVVLVALGTPDEAARVAAAAGVATVLVVAGPRDEHVDRALRDHAHVLVAGHDLVADLAAHSVRTLGVAAATVALADAPVARALAASGTALAGPWRAPIREALA